MALILRGNLNRALTHAELDNNFTQLSIPEWSYASFEKDRFVYHTDSYGITTLYVCVTSHSKAVYKPSLDFKTTSGNKVLWKSVGDNASAGGAFGTFVLYDTSGNTTTVAAIDTDRFIKFSDSDTIAVEWTGSYFKFETIGGPRQFPNEVGMYQLGEKYRKQGQWFTVLDSIYGQGGMKWYTLDGGISNAYFSEIKFGGGSGGSYSGGTIGVAEDGSYADGILDDLTSSTPIGTAVDRFNEVIKNLAPQQPPAVSSLTSDSTGVTVKLSWGDSNNNIMYNLVDNSTLNPDVDVNEVMYATGSTRLGLLNDDLMVIINGDVPASDTGSYIANAFSNASTGYLKLFLNDDEIDSLDLDSASTGATVGDNGIISVSAVKNVLTAENKPFKNYTYRTASFTVLKENFEDGYNYIKVEHWKGSVASTNYLDFVYDSNTDQIAVKPATTPKFTNIDLPTGSTKYISGVKYNTAGTAEYTINVNNVYSNVYSADDTAFDYNLTNLTQPTEIVFSGDHVVPTTGYTTELPNIVASGANAQDTNIIIRSTHNIQANRILGTGTTASSIIGLSMDFVHPISDKSVSAIGNTSRTGFLFDSLTQTPNLESEDFIGETYRVKDVAYNSTTWADVNNGVYDWDSSENLVTGGAGYTTGLLVFDGKLMYPNSPMLDDYGIANGKFDVLSLAPNGNPDYTLSSGFKKYVRRFKSSNGSSLSTLSFRIGYTGDVSNFENTYAGSPAGQQIKVEFMVKRVNGITRGWYNPFATASSNPDGISIIGSPSTDGNYVDLTTTLNTLRVGINDIILLRVTVNNNWASYINNLAITNI